jgi:hypothetical protein
VGRKHALSFPSVFRAWNIENIVIDRNDTLVHMTPTTAFNDYHWLIRKQ